MILHNASICAVQPLWYEPIYNVTKSALMMFSKCLATEVVGDNIRVNCINPGLILTPDWKKTARRSPRTSAATGKAISRASPTSTRRSNASARRKSWRTSSSFLCSDKATYSIGSTYFVDGGMQKGL